MRGYFIYLCIKKILYSLNIIIRIYWAEYEKDLFLL